MRRLKVLVSLASPLFGGQIWSTRLDNIITIFIRRAQSKERLGVLVIWLDRVRLEDD